MKIKQFLTITDPAEFLRGDYSSCFNLFSQPSGGVSKWIDCGPVEFDVDIDTGKVHQVAMDEIETKLTAARVLLNTLENQKRDLLAIGYDGDPQKAYAPYGHCDICGTTLEYEKPSPERHDEPARVGGYWCSECEDWS